MKENIHYIQLAPVLKIIIQFKKVFNYDSKLGKNPKYKNLQNIKGSVGSWLLLVGITDTENNARPITVYIHLHASFLYEVISSNSDNL